MDLSSYDDSVFAMKATHTRTSLDRSLGLDSSNDHPPSFEMALAPTAPRLIILPSAGGANRDDPLAAAGKKQEDGPCADKSPADAANKPTRDVDRTTTVGESSVPPDTGPEAQIKLGGACAPKVGVTSICYEDAPPEVPDHQLGAAKVANAIVSAPGPYSRAGPIEREELNQFADELLRLCGENTCLQGRNAELRDRVRTLEDNIGKLTTEAGQITGLMEILTGLISTKGE